MVQFDVYCNANPATRVVVPLCKSEVLKGQLAQERPSIIAALDLVYTGI